MRIAAVTIRNYRSLRDVTIQLDDYCVFIGANGAGKSSVLYALDWFFNGTALEPTDVHGFKEGEALPAGVRIEVAVTFVGLTPKDRERLQQYGRGERVEIRRTWYVEDKRVKTVGNSKQGPGFAEVRADQGAKERRAKYRELRMALPELPDLGGVASKDAIIEALELWESDPANRDALVDVADSDATQMMGWHGPNVLRECVRFVLIPAATSIASEVGTAAKGTALTELVGQFMSEASARAQAEWLQKHADAVAELSDEIRESIERATGVQADRINSRLAEFVPNASVTLTPTVPGFAPKVDPSIATTVTIDGIANDVSRQGHGVQRAVMISMLQAMVPDEYLMREMQTLQDGEDEAAFHARLEETLVALPTIVVALEEPEIYQHPIRARTFARTLGQLSREPRVQILLATHSPYFVQPEQFSALRRFTCLEGRTSVGRTTVSAVAAACDSAEEKIVKAITAYFSTEFSEGFFADAVALVEGQTDRVVIEAVAAKLGQQLDRSGVSVLSVEGKSGLRVARAILTSLGIPTYVLADGDFSASDRKVYKDLTKAEIDAARAQAHESHKKATTELVAALPTALEVTHGAQPYSFGDPTIVCADFTLWQDDIEEELGAWPSFEAELSNADVSLAARVNKNLLAYRNAVVAASANDMPQVLRAVVASIVRLTGRATPAAAHEPSTAVSCGGELTYLLPD